MRCQICDCAFAVGYLATDAVCPSCAQDLQDMAVEDWVADEKEREEEEQEGLCDLCGRDAGGYDICARCEAIADAMECPGCGAASSLSCRCC